MATQPTDPKPRPAADTAARTATPRPAGIPARIDGPAPGYEARALLLWPGLDRGRLTATRGNPARIARLVARRTALPPETIMRMLGVRGGVHPTIEGRARDD